MSLAEIFELLTFGGLLVSPAYLLPFILIAFAIYFWRGETGGFLRWLFPKQIILNRSTGIDVTLFAVNQVLELLGIVARFAATPLVAAYVAGIVPVSPFAGDALSPVGLALLFVLVADFTVYWSHRAYHTIKVIWPLHAVHHSAEVMTPITAYRAHPLSLLLLTSFNTVVIGALLGLLVGGFRPESTIWEIAGANAFVVVINMTLLNFHHSHIWVSFGPILERVVISPAQHQVHHSRSPEHYNKNYGRIFAIWDWMFGTLYITRRNENVTFGLEDPEDAPLMTQRLWPILWDPMRRIFMQMTGRV
ncbi:MAG: sterol desaturase family protein [Pseudomonadota bacterium]